MVLKIESIDDIKKVITEEGIGIFFDKEYYQLEASKPGQVHKVPISKLLYPKNPITPYADKVTAIGIDRKNGTGFSEIARSTIGHVSGEQEPAKFMPEEELYVFLCNVMSLKFFVRYIIPNEGDLLGQHMNEDDKNLLLISKE